MTHAGGTDQVTVHEDVLDEVSELIASLQSHPDPLVGQQLAALLAGIDAVHRTALSHMFDAIQGMGGEAFVSRLTADPAIRLLLMSYDLLAVDRRLNTEEALDAVRGHLHSHGVDVELLDVAGSEVFVRLHGLAKSGLAEDAVRRDIEAALADGLIGFQVLTIGDREPPVKASDLVQLAGLRTVNRPVYHRAFRADELPPGSLRAVEAEGDSIVVANVDGEFYAVANRCGESPLPLSFSVLDGSTIVCSWHGCRYDVRSGTRTDPAGGERIRVYPVRIEAGSVEVAVGVEPVARGDGARAESR